MNNFDPDPTQAELLASLMSYEQEAERASEGCPVLPADVDLEAELATFFQRLAE